MTPPDATGAEGRTGDANFEVHVQREAARLQGILDERARRSGEEWTQHVRDTIMRDKDLIEAGRLDTHVCPWCLLGYASYQLERFCPTGRQYVLARAKQ